MASAVSKVKRQKSHLSFTILQNVPAAIGVCLFKIVFEVYYIYQRWDRVTAHIYRPVGHLELVLSFHSVGPLGLTQLTGLVGTFTC